MSGRTRTAATRRAPVLAHALALLLAVGLAVTGCTTVEGTSTSPGASSTSPSQQPDAEAPSEFAARLSVTRHRGGQRVIAASGAPATDHGATLLREGNSTRLWWCGRTGGTKRAGTKRAGSKHASRASQASRTSTVILHGSARSPGGPFTGAGGTKRGKKSGATASTVLSGGKRGFDAAHTCDPSVIKVDGVYYLYYTGTTGKPSTGNAIGVATSKDGLRWRRANGGAPIVRPAQPKRNGYGAGRPAVVHLDGWFYLLFSDSTDSPGKSAGQYLLRSRDPAFRKQVQAIGARGFRPVQGTGASRTRSIADAADADLMWVDLLDAFAIAHQTGTGTTLTFWDRGFNEHPNAPVTVRGPGSDDPGLVRTLAGHALRSERDPCGAVPVDLVRAARATSKRPGLRHVGVDLGGAPGCADRADALRLLDGYAFPSPEHTMDLIVDGELIRVERRSVATILASNGVLARRPQLPGIGVTARLNSGAPVLRSRDGQTGLLLDDGRLWPLRMPALAKRIARRNESAVRTAGDIAWGTYPVASVLG
ncbi:MAG: beta-xylosidase [Actinophytocola sp.]|nr:beta-xylosidase [Actinophytocola sp.]